SLRPGPRGADLLAASLWARLGPTDCVSRRTAPPRPKVGGEEIRPPRPCPPPLRPQVSPATDVSKEGAGVAFPAGPRTGAVTLGAVPAGNDGALPPELLAATLALLEELTAISSASGDVAGLGRMAARLAAVLAARGLAVEVLQGLGPGGVANATGPGGG